MKLNVLLGFVLVTALIKQIEPLDLKSSIKDAIVIVLHDVNILATDIATQANDLFLEKLGNETEIQEWAVNVQVKKVTDLTKSAFGVFNAYKDYIISKSATDREEKVLTCISNEETDLVASLGDAASQNGWCNNKLAANITRAYQATTESIIKLSDSFGEDIHSLSSCILGDDICLSAFIVDVIELAESALSPTSSLAIALKDVMRVYSILFDQDIPKCDAQYLLPLIVKGLENALDNISKCILSQF